MASPLVDAGLLPLANLDYPQQLARKQAYVQEAFSRRNLKVSVQPTVPSPHVEGARARVKLRAGPRGQLGFYRPGTHDFIRVPLEALARTEIVETAAALEAFGTARGEVELRSDGKRVVVDASVRFEGPEDLSVEGRKVRGNPTLQIDGLRVSPGSFYQVNLELNRLLVASLDAHLVQLAPVAVLDLYGGIGNLSAPAHRRGTPVTLVESNKAAAADARVNLPGATILAKDAGRFQSGDALADVVLLDPPRAGAPGVLKELALTRPRAILYVSCDPVSLARDVASVAAGYDIAWVEPWDMFPGADHVETLAVLTRGATTKLR